MDKIGPRYSVDQSSSVASLASITSNVFLQPLSSTPLFKNSILNFGNTIFAISLCTSKVSIAPHIPYLYVFAFKVMASAFSRFALLSM